MAAAVRTKCAASADSRQFWSAIESGDAKQLEEILASGPSLNSTDTHGSTPLLRAACYDRVEVIRTLIERGANVNAVRLDGFTPLLLAVFFGHADVVRVLVESGADVTATTRFGTSAQMWATARGFHDISEYLQQRAGGKSQVPAVDYFLKNSIDVPEAPVATPVVVDPLESTNHNINPPAPRGNSNIATTHTTGRDEPREPVVRTLKDPPEIWDLVHENRSHFDASATFVSRIVSMKARTVAIAATILIAMIAVPVVIKLNGVAPRAATATPVVLSGTSNAGSAVLPPEPIKSVTESPDQAVTSNSSEKNSVLAPESRGPSSGVSDSQGAKVVGAHSQVTSGPRLTKSARPQGSERRAIASNTSIGAEETADTGQNTQATQAIESNSNTNARVIKDPVAVKKPSVVTTNSHLIDRPSGSPTTKPKVIQWP